MKTEVNKFLVTAADTAQQVALAKDCENVTFNISITNTETSAATVEIFVTDAVGSPSKIDTVGKATLSENGGGIDIVVKGKASEKVFVKSSIIGPIVRVTAEYEYE